MKIALYVPSWPPGVVPNGIVTYASYLVPALRQLGHEVFVLTPVIGEADPYTVDLKEFAPRQNIFDRALFRFAPKTALFNMVTSGIAAAVRHLVTNHGINVFEMEESLGFCFGVSRLNIVPVVVRLHGPWFLIGQFDGRAEVNSHRERMEGRGIQRAHYVTAPSLATLNAVKNHYGLSLTRSRVIPNPVDAVPEEEKWNIDTCEQDRILFVGRFDKPKGGDLVLRAFAQLAASCPRLKLTFVGPDRGIKASDGRVLHFDHFVQENLPEAVRSRINFRGQMKHAEVRSLRANCFLTIVASQQETVGYSVLEAMSFGCPLVAFAVGGIPEYINDRRNGLLVPSQDPHALAAACKILLDNGALAAQIGRQARLDCRDLYNSKNVAQQMISLYREAIDTGHARQAMPVKYG